MTTPLIAQTAIQHYLSMGISKDVAVGICSVLYRESALNPGSQGSQSTETPGSLNPAGAYGIASWNGPRQAALAAFAKEKNENPSQLTTQLDFVLTESANSYPAVWAAIQNPSMTYQKFIPIMVDSYEIPANTGAETADALKYAEAWYPDVVPAAPPPVAAPTAPPVVSMAEGPLAVVQALAKAIASSQSQVAIQALAQAILKEFA